MQHEDAPGATRGVRVEGRGLGLDDLTDLALGRAHAVVDRDVLGRLGVLHEAMGAARERGAVYGATTGVGANKDVEVDDEQHEHPQAHGLRLLRSHAASLGPVEDEATTRAALVVRLNQLLAGAHAGLGAGISPPVLRALAEAVESGALPTLHRFGGIGTSDLAPLAELGLTLVGERPWRRGAVAPVPLGAADALPLISSHALTLATASLALCRLRQLLLAGTGISALSFLALRGNPQAWAPPVHAARAHPAQTGLAATLHALVAGGPEPARLQDPFALRTAPQVLAPAFTAAQALEDVLALEASTPGENPLVSPEGVFHHGQFHAASLATALDTLRATTFGVLTLSAARLALLLRPEHTGLRAFLAAGPRGSSGLMIGEYVVQDVLAELRPATAPSTSGTVSISLGLEEHASFATQGARALRQTAELAPVVLAVEALAAVRALRAAPDRLSPGAAALFAVFDEVLGRDSRDAPIGPDVEAVVARVVDLSLLVRVPPV
ncbi:histidine ammonia-lyase [Kineococcus radiotolerans]|uniref:Histidine ammonia-lyase n=1 Tax=Kineococcus radiotolerans TaxID=131568 RepID=A0A7W4XWD0_KINRA|nr:aromatic amino acid lyase [Kineococcus radiotolerans]MBB2900030.1 histidine ammonia-lyase [Kineococcus radiotolerans]